MHCPKCGQRYPDGFQRFCDLDGTRLAEDPAAYAPRESALVSGLVAGTSARSENVRNDDDFSVLELDDEIIPADDEVIRDEEMAKLFVGEPTGQDLSHNRRPEPEPEPETEPEPLPPAIPVNRIDPYSIPQGHVDLNERNNSLEQLNEFTPNAPANFVGKTVKGRYRVVEMLGEDDGGHSYVAEDKIVDDKRVVVRILAPDAADEITASIIAEERISLSHLNHPNVARIFDSGQFMDGTKFLVSEHLDGLTAQDILAIHGKFDLARAAKLIRQAANAVGDVHKQGILHRDIRPANIEIASGENDSSTMKIVNFGVSSGEPNSLNAWYSAPEVLSGGVSTVSSDLYALGVTAHELVTGKMPFEAASDKELLQEQRSGYHGELGSRLDNFFARALSPDPRARFFTAREFGEAFYKAASETGRISEPSVVPKPPRNISDVVVAATGHSENGPAWARRSTEPINEPNSKLLKIAAISFALLAVIFAGLWIYMLNKPAPQSGSTAVNADGTPVSAQYDPAETPPPIREIAQPPDSTYFESNKQTLKGDLFRNFAAFSLYLPKHWTVTGPKESTTSGIRGKFLDISKSTPDGDLQEQMLISYYPSRGTFSDDSVNFPALVSESNATLAKLIPGFQVVSEGPIVFNGGWKAYEVKFQGSGPAVNGQRLLLWGRRLFVPAARPGVRIGFEITLLATSNSDDVRSVDDIGVRDGLANVLYTFEPGRNF